MLKDWLEFQSRHAALVFIVLLLLVGLYGYYGLQLKIDPALESLISPTSEYNINERILVNAFGQRDVMIVLVKPDRHSILPNRPGRMDDPSLQQYYSDLMATLRESQFVDFISEPEYSKDRQYARIVIAMHVPDNVEGYNIVEQELKSLMAQVGTPPGIEAELTGFALLLNRIPSLLISDSLKTMIITLAMIFLILIYYFKNFRLAAISISTPLLGIIILSGVMVVLGIEVTVTLAAVGVFILGLGVDYGIHICAHFQNERKKGIESKEAIIATMHKLWLPITASFMTTFAGFAALILGYSPSSQSQGAVLALGILIIYFLSIVMVPVLLHLFGAKIEIKHNPLFDLLTAGLIRLALFQSRRPKTVLAIIAILTVVFFIGLTKVKFSTSNSNWIPDDDPLSLSFREIAFQYGDVTTINIVLEAQREDLRDVLTVRDAQKLASLLRNVPLVQSVESPFDDITLDKSQVHNILTNERTNQFNRDFRLATLTIITENPGQDEAGNSLILKDIREVLEKTPIHNAKVSLFGDMVRFDELGKSLQQDAQRTTIIGFSLVFLVASLLYSSFLIGISALIPIILAIIWSTGLMGFFNVPFTSLSTGIVSIVLGIGADFSIHLVDGVKRNIARGHSMEKSLKETLHNTGSPILLSSLTTLFGFLALTGATLLGTQRLGLSLALSMIAVFVVVVSMVPALMALYLRKKLKGTRKAEFL